MKNKIISVLLLMAILFSNISMINPQNALAADMDYSVEYNQQEITDLSEDITDVYIVDVQQSAAASTASTYAASKSGTWYSTSDGKWYYVHSDNTITVNNWEYIDGYWYYFNSNGYRQTGWLKVGNYWYHLDNQGRMQTGWQKLSDGYWYYFNSSGIRQVGWLKDGGKWYHLNDTNGIMDTGWKYVHNGWYYFNSDGVRQTGWLSEGGYKYYLNSDGIMQISWQQISGKWYHFDAKGHMDIGWHYIGDWWYYFNSEGVMVRNSFISDYRYYEFADSGELVLTNLLITRQEQETDNWCWAASAAMVGNYYTNSQKTQKEIVWYVKGFPLDVRGSIENTIKGINFASGFTKSAEERNLFGSFSSAVNEIDSNRPFLLCINWFDGGSHAVVCAGYRNTKTQKQIRIIDPYQGCGTRLYAYDNFNSDVTLESGRGRCEKIIIYKYK